MYIIGLTGGIATGKSTVAQMLRGLDVPVLDADALAHAVTAPGGAALPSIRQRFGDAVFIGGVLNRRALGALVFADAQARAALEAIVHPLVFAALAQALEALRGQGAPLAVVDMPLLFETGYDAQVDAIWVTDVAQDEQVRRVMVRDALTEDEARARVASQWPQAEKRSRAQVCIHTEGTSEKTGAQVREAWRQALQAAQSLRKVDTHATTP